METCDPFKLIPGELYWLCPEPDSPYMCVNLTMPVMKGRSRMAFCDTRHPILYTATDDGFLQFIGVEEGGEPLVFGVELAYYQYIRKLSDGPFGPNHLLWRV
jgi:hypothetical protein